MANAPKPDAGTEAPKNPREAADAERTRLREAAETERRHQREREDAARAVADRNRKAHERAVARRDRRPLPPRTDY
jgi:hypothetical protein